MYDFVIDPTSDPNDYAALMDSAGGAGGSSSMGRSIVLPADYWPSEEQHARTTEAMETRGIAAPPRGTIDSQATQQLGAALYEEEGFLDDPRFIAAFVMGGAALGGAFANGGAGWGAGAGAGSSGAAQTFPLASGGPVTVSAIPGVTAGVPAAAGGAAAAGAGGILDSSGAVIPGTEVAGNAAGAAAPAATRGIGSFLRNNRDIIGNVVAGIGDSMAADEAHENDVGLLRERHALTSSNYQGTDPGRTFRGLAPGTSRATPVERFDRYSGFEYVWDAKLNRIVKQPIQATPQ